MAFWGHYNDNLAAPTSQQGGDLRMSPMPPPPQPAPMGGSAPAAGVGSNKKTYTILAYLLGWITGLIFLFVGKALQGNGEGINPPGLSGFMNQYVDQIANAVK